MKKIEENCNFQFFWKIFAPLEAKMMKNEKNMIKHVKKMTRIIAIFLFFGKFLHHWKQKWWKMIKKTDKKWKNSRKIAIFNFFGKLLHHWKQKWWKMIKNDKNMKKTRKIVIFNFLEKNCTTGSKNDEKWKKHDKKCLKKWKKLEENCNFPIFGKFLQGPGSSQVAWKLPSWVPSPLPSSSPPLFLPSPPLPSPLLDSPPLPSPSLPSPPLPSM